MFVTVGILNNTIDDVNVSLAIKAKHLYGLFIRRALQHRDVRGLLAIMTMHEYTDGHPERAFRKSQIFGLGPKNVGTFSADLQYPSWHCESIVHGFEYFLFYNRFWISGRKYINPK
jgi:hypothetical protein